MALGVHHTLSEPKARSLHGDSLVGSEPPDHLRLESENLVDTTPKKRKICTTWAMLVHLEVE